MIDPHKGQAIRPRVCACCNETKHSNAFTFSSKYKYAKHCRECGQWLKLFRAEFGAPTPVRSPGKTKSARAAATLWNAWMQPTQGERYEENV